jgi:hypothetical protein
MPAAPYRKVCNGTLQVGLATVDDDAVGPALADRCEAPLPNRVGQVFTADSDDSALYIFVSTQRNAQSWPKGNLGLGILRPAQTSRHWV